MLKISHSQHTGRHLPREHTSFAVLFGLVAMIGLLLLVVGRFNTAALPASVSGGGSISVNAVVPGPAPRQPAVILYPHDGQHFTNSDVTVYGTCQPDSLIKIFKNDILAGAVICASNGTFSLPINLLPGRNVLRAETYNTLNEQGPPSPTVTVYYDAPAGAAGISPLVLDAEDLYKGHNVGEEIDWTINITGGQPPYAIAVDWGDGTVDPVSRTQAGAFVVKHIYKSAGPLVHQSYNISVKATDAADGAARLQLVTIVVGPSGIGAPGSPIPSIAWMLWLLLFLLLVAFRVGEIVEKRYLKGRLKRPVPGMPSV